MKKLIVMAFMAISGVSFAQSVVKNGSIYKEHPYITAVEKLTALFPSGDTTALAAFYADTARFLDSPDPKFYNLKQAIANWKDIYANWEQITITKVGYPDGLEYASDPFTVQSWWKITAVNKKTKKQASFQEVVFDSFNKDGKITMELSYYDPSAMMDAMK